MTVKHAPPSRFQARLFSPTLSRWAISAALLLSAGAASAIPPATLYVATTGSDSNSGTQTSPFLTINAAITASYNGGTIDIADGTYTGPGNVDLDTNGTNLTFQSDHGAASTIIDCGGTRNSNYRGFYIHSGETVTLSGLTVKNAEEDFNPQNGYSPGSGVEVDGNSNLTIQRCTFQNNNDTAQILARAGSTLTINDTTISSGGQSTQGVASYGTLRMTSCRVNNNGAGVNSIAGSSVLTNCLLINNQTFNFSGHSPSSLLTCCTLTGGGLGGVISQFGSVTLQNVIVRGPTALYIDTASLIVNHCDIEGTFPTGTTDGGGNIDADPLFVSGTDFHLQSTSPCLGVGTRSGAPATDIEGTTRPNPPSMGAYEVGVAPATLASITITANSASIVAGSTDQFTAMATYSDSTTADVTASATWASSDTAKATIDATTGLATGIAVGTANITATVGSVTSAQTTLTVNAAIVTPPPASDYVLWDNADGRACVWNMNDTDPTTTYRLYGPFPGWTAKTIAEGADGDPRLLWTNADGRICLWDLEDTDPVAGSHIYGPFPKWAAKSMAIGSDNMPRILWSNTNGQMSLWNVDSTGVYTHNEYGPFHDWTAKTVAVGSDNDAHVLWNGSDGTGSLWDIDTSGAYSYHYAGPFAGWNAKALSIGVNNTTHLLWQNTSGVISVWNVNFSDTSFAASSNLYGPYAGWTVNSIADDQDGQTRVLGNNTDGRMSLWSLNSNTAAYTHHEYGPYPGWTAISVAAPNGPAH